MCYKDPNLIVVVINIKFVKNATSFLACYNQI